MASQPIYILCTPEPTPTNVSSLILVNMSVSIVDSEAWFQNQVGTETDQSPGSPADNVSVASHRDDH